MESAAAERKVPNKALCDGQERCAKETLELGDKVRAFAGRVFLLAAQSEGKSVCPR